MAVNLERAKREQVRWRLLALLDAGRPIGVAETLLLGAIIEAMLPATPMEIRRELDYLEEKGLVRVARGDVWTAELTADGIDVVEYAAPVPVGIARPPHHSQW